MKILFINSVCGVKSTGRICTDLAEVLETRGHTCKIAYGRGVAPEKYNKFAIRIGNDVGVRIDGVKTRLFDNAGFNSINATKKFISQVKAYNPDIIHLHNIHGYYINIKHLFDFLKEFGRPVFWTLHDCWAFTGHCAHFSFIGCSKWKVNGCYDCPQAHTYPASLFIDNSKRNYQLKKSVFSGVENLHIITPSNWLAHRVRESFLNEYEVTAIPNGIDLSVFKPTFGNFRKKYDLEDKKIILGVATDWTYKKGLNDFIALSKIISKKMKIVLVGLSDTQISKLPNEILGINRTNNLKELAEIYTCADVFINASKEETMGLTTVEAMACGTPVIVTDLTAVPEVVDENGGIVLKDFNPNNIFSAINTILNSDYSNTHLNARKYEKSQQYQKYIDLYLGEYI